MRNHVQIFSQKQKCLDETALEIINKWRLAKLKSKI